MDVTLGAIALLDPAIKIGNKVWKKWKLQKNFGKDFVKYSDFFYDEGVILEELLRTPISLLVDGEASSELEFILERVGSSDELEQLFEGRPAAFTKTRQILRTLAKLHACFNDCAALIDKYAPAEATKTQLDTSTNGSLYKMKSTSDSSTSDQNSNASLFSSKRTPLLKRVSTGVFRRGSKASSIDSRSSTSSIPEALRHPAIEQEAQSGMLRAASAQSSTSTMTRLWDWANEDISRFKSLIHEIQAGNAFIERLVQIAGASKNQAPQESSASLITTSAVLEEATGPYLKILAEVLQNSTRARDATFALELKESYKTYADNVRKEGAHAYLEIEEGGRLFPLSAFTKKSTDSVDGAGLQTGTYSDVVLNMKPALEIIADNDSLADAKSDANNSSCWKFDHGALRRSLPSASYYEKQGAIVHSSHSIRIFQHFPASNQHLGYLKSLLHDNRLRDSELIAFRYHLAYSVATFYISALQTPFAVRKPDLVFFLEQPPLEIDAESLAVRLAAPYIYGFNGQGLSGKAQGKEQSLQGARFAGQVTSLQRLGILLHEIGAWQAIEGVRLSDALDRTWVELPRSQESMGLRYRNAVRFCLDATSEQDSESFRKCVLAPLLSLKMGHVLPSIEIYE